MGYASSIIVNENEPGLCDDTLKLLARLVSKGAEYSNDRIDHNADAHLKAILLGYSETLPIVGGEVLLGR